MSMMSLAMWLQQDNDPSAATRHLILIFFLVITIGVAILAVIMMYVGFKALSVVKELSATAEEMKTKFLPLLDEVMHISKTSRVMLEDAAPKIKTISANLVKASDSLVETSLIARSAVEKVEGTIADANLRTQRQVARVDGMVSAALATTQEVADTIANGIRVPAMKIAEMLQQAKSMAEGLIAKVKGGTVVSSFGGRRREE